MQRSTATVCLALLLAVATVQAHGACVYCEPKAQQRS